MVTDDTFAELIYDDYTGRRNTCCHADDDIRWYSPADANKVVSAMQMQKPYHYASWQ